MTRRIKILFSADAFGSFHSLDGNLFSDEVNYDLDWLDEAAQILYEYRWKIWRHGTDGAQKAFHTCTSPASVRYMA